MEPPTYSPAPSKDELEQLQLELTIKASLLDNDDTNPSRSATSQPTNPHELAMRNAIEESLAFANKRQASPNRNSLASRCASAANSCKMPSLGHRRTSRPGQPTAADLPAQPETSAFWPNVERWLHKRREPAPPVKCFECQSELEVTAWKEDNGEREPPLVLGCGHAVGSRCFSKWSERAMEDGTDLECPYCKQEVVTAVL